MRRRLSIIEHLLWMGGKQFGVFSTVATLRGQITLEQLKIAIGKAKQRHPNLALQVELTDDYRLYHMTEGVADFPVRVVERANETTWTKMVESEVQMTFPWQTGPFVGFVLVSSPDVSELIITCHHGYADGLSGAYLMRDLLTYLGDPDHSVEPLPLLPSYDQLVPTAQSGVGDIDIQVYESEVEPPATAITEPFFVLPRIFPREQMTALTERCRAEKTSVHGIVSAAYLKAFADQQGYRKRTVSSPVNVRNRLRQPVGENFGVFIYPGILAGVDFRPDHDLWAAARDIQSTTQAQITDEVLFGGLDSIGGLFAGNSYRDVLNIVFPSNSRVEVNYDLSISNLGRLDIPTQYGSLYLEALYGPLVNALEAETILGVNTIGGQMTLTWVGRHKTLDPQLADQIQHCALQYLADAVG